MKAKPNHRIYIQVLRRMGPEGRLRKAFELSEFSRALFRRSLETAHPDLDDEALHRLYLERLRKAQDRPE